MKRGGKKIALFVAMVGVLLLPIVVWLSWDNIRFLMDFESLGKNPQGYGEYRHRETGIVFVLLPGGEFHMGTSDEEAERWNAVFRESVTLDFPRNYLAAEQPGHKVRLRPFLIAKYELSQAEWVRVMGDNPSQFRGDALPVERVSWLDCQEFCRKTGLSMPTEACWEYSCRAGTSTAFAFGESVTPKQVRFFDPNAPVQKFPYRTVPVDSFEPNAFGLYNMHGNVMEWCEDMYDVGFYKNSESHGVEPVARSSGGSLRVCRGGSAIQGAIACRSAFRFGVPPTEARRLSGFRPSVPFFIAMDRASGTWRKGPPSAADAER